MKIILLFCKGYYGDFREELLMKYLLIISEVPADQKLVSIVLIFKIDIKEDSRNYRPINLTSVSDRVMEKIFLGGIEKHLKDSTVSDHNQYG